MAIGVDKLNWDAYARFFPLAVRAAVEEKGVWICGGSMAKFINGEPIGDSDIDIFSTNPEAALDKLSQVYPIIRESSTSWTLQGPGSLEVQVVKYPYMGITEALESFDFTVSMVGTDGQWVFMGHNTEEDLRDKRLRFNPDGNLEHRTSQLYRLVRYGNKGYHLAYEDAREFLMVWGVPPHLVATNAGEGGRS